MIITLRDSELTLENTPEAVRELLQMIDNIRETENCSLNCMIVNGLEIFDDYEDYLLDRLSQVETIQVSTQTHKESLDDALLSALGYLDRALPFIKELASEFYRGASAETWEKFQQLLEAMQWLGEFINKMEEGKHLFASWKSNFSVSFNFSEIVNNLNQAINNSDLILIGDTLKYEFVPLLDTLRMDIQRTVDSEVVRNDLN
ncbi:MAG: hypothetical protein APF81_00400 [Desulfosporosinus sp. BRH_c37]|nr:MAG: hypothetical protein APF81_00400 [Desulfosporosinus sp. BRH_c37]